MIICIHIPVLWDVFYLAAYKDFGNWMTTKGNTWKTSKILTDMEAVG